MGVQQSKKELERVRQSTNAINSIYAMFEQSNAVVLAALRLRNPKLSKSKIKNVGDVIDQLMQPFGRYEKYQWGPQIQLKFKKHFTNSNFQQLWIASRQQFYQLLLVNCKVDLEELLPKGQQVMAHQDAFYAIASQQLEVKMVDSIMGDVSTFEIRKNVLKLTITQEIQHVSHGSQEGSQKNKEALGQMRVEASSLIMPQTLFIHKMSIASQNEIFDLLKFYRQFTDTLQQIFCSNNLISCPIKHFIVTLQQKIGKKKIKTESIKKTDLLGMSEESRKVRKIRETNNNIILTEMKAFLDAYTEFVWMFLELYLMEESNLGKIIQSEILYSIIFKNLWSFFQWIADRGYQYEEAELEEYFQKNQLKVEATIAQPRMKVFLGLLNSLRNEKHPQIYLKKLVIFYREVSKDCQNADDLLGFYEQVMREGVKTNGLRDLRLFKMRNIIDKLLKIQQGSLSGGQITYAWTTWRILIELLKEKVTYKYGKLMIKGKVSSSGQINFKESQLDWDFDKVNETEKSSSKIFMDGDLSLGRNRTG